MTKHENTGSQTMTTAQPDSNGFFGPFGGCYVPDTLMRPLKEVEEAFFRWHQDAAFMADYHRVLKDYVGRPTPLTFAARLTEQLGGAKIYLKREDLTHTGAHKINNTIGQISLAKKMGKKRIIAETGAGQHGVATATVAALAGLECVVYMGAVDMARQAPNVKRMKLLGAKVVPVTSGSQTLKDAINQAMRDWAASFAETFYIFGSALGPFPYPVIVREFQRVIGDEALKQIEAQEGRLPDECVACVGGGSNAIGLFTAFLPHKDIALTGVEAGGDGEELGRHAARFSGGSLGVLHGSKTYLLQGEGGQVAHTHSVSAGLDYPAIGPEHAWLREQGRAQYVSASDGDALAAFRQLSKLEGIIPALESSHAIAYAIARAPQLSKEQVLLVNLSGRGDKDLEGVSADD